MHENFKYRSRLPSSTTMGVDLMKKTILTLSVVLIIFLFGCAPTQPGVTVTGVTVTEPTPTVGTVKLGVMMPLTGDAAAYGNPIFASTQIAVDEINAQGGINGKQIELIVEDSKCNPKDGATAAQKLVNVDKVVAILGGVCSGETLGAAPIAEAAKVIMLSPSSTSPDITNAGDFIFRTAPSDALAGKIAADVAYNTLNARTAAIITETQDYPQGLRRVFKKNFEKLGGTVAIDEAFNSEATDFRTLVLKVKDANPDVIYVVPQAPAKGVLIVKQIKEAGLETQLLTAEGLIGRDVIKENPEDLEGMIGVEAYFDESNPKAIAVLGEYTKRTGEEPPFPAFMAAAYDNVYLIKKAMEQSETPEGMRDFLYSVKDWQGALGKLTIDQNGDPILKYSVQKVTSGKVSTMAIV